MTVVIAIAFAVAGPRHLKKQPGKPAQTKVTVTDNRKKAAPEFSLMPADLLLFFVKHS